METKSALANLDDTDSVIGSLMVLVGSGCRSLCLPGRNIVASQVFQEPCFAFNDLILLSMQLIGCKITAIIVLIISSIHL